MGLPEVLHEIIGHLPIHEKTKAELHDKTEEAFAPEPGEEKSDEG